VRHAPLNTPADRAAAAPGATVADLGERAIVARIRERLPASPPWMIVAAGDDAAVVEPVRGALEVLTADGLVEGNHFDHRSSRPFVIGW
jgi:thiamine-monophosphate kinase